MKQHKHGHSSSVSTVNADPLKDALLVLYLMTTINMSLISWFVYCFFLPQSDLITTAHGWVTVWASAIIAFSTASSSLCLFWRHSYLAVSSHTLLCVSILTHQEDKCPQLVAVTYLSCYPRKIIFIITLFLLCLFFCSPGSQAGRSLVQAIQESPARYPLYIHVTSHQHYTCWWGLLMVLPSRAKK